MSKAGTAHHPSFGSGSHLRGFDTDPNDFVQNRSPDFNKIMEKSAWFELFK